MNLAGQLSRRHAHLPETHKTLPSLSTLTPLFKGIVALLVAPFDRTERIGKGLGT
jgi:hypothetical protein